MNELVTPTAEDLQALVEQVWTSYVDPEPLLPAAPLVDPGCWSAVTTVTGAWRGMVTVELPERAAHAVATRMLEVAEASREEMADAVGELVNMVGGNVKSLMPEPSQLSLPMVASGSITLPSGAQEACRADLAWQGMPITVRVHLLENDAEGAA